MPRMLPSLLHMITGLQDVEETGPSVHGFQNTNTHVLKKMCTHPLGVEEKKESPYAVSQM